MADVILTSGGLSLTRDMLAAPTPATAPYPPQFIAVASGQATVGRYWTGLQGETFRAPIVGRDAAGGAVIYHAFLNIGDNANQSVGAYALVAGADATSVPGGPGTYFAVGNEPNPFGKNATSTLNLDIILTVSGTVGS